MAIPRSIRSHAPLLACLAIASALHALVLFNVDWRRPATQPAPTLALTLTGSVVAPGRPPPTAPTAQAGIPPKTLPPAPSPATADTPEPEAPPRPNTELAATTPPVHGAIAGKTVDELVRAVAEATATATNDRVFRLGETPPKRADFAYYLASWRRKVERIGKLNYPQRARAERITGSLRLRVVIAADGALRDARVMRSSGHTMLDEAALAIVRLAAPYAPFSPAMRETTDVLEIERTWRFLASGVSS